MPSFGRIGKHSNRSQHNLVEQQQQQHHHHHHHLLQQQQQQQQLSSHQHQVAGSGATAPPHHPHQQQAGSTSISASQTGSSPLNPGGRRVSAAGVPITVPVTSSVPIPVSINDSNTTPSSASSIGLSSSESFQQQLPPPQQQQQQVDTRAGQSQSQQQTPHTSPRGHQHTHHNQLGSQQQSQSAQPLEAYGNNQNNLPTSSVPLNQTPAAYTARQQPHDNFAELVSRSQSARYSQLNPLQTQQPFGIASSSVDNLPQTVSSPSVTTSQPSLSHSQTAPTEPKRSTRKLIKNILSGSSSSSRPNSDHYQDASYDNNSGLNRRPSKRASNTPVVRGNPLLSRPIDHPDWVPPQSSSRSHHSPIQPNHTEPSQNTIRQVPADSDPDADNSPYSREDLSYQQQAIAQHQAQLQAQAQAQAHAQAQAQAHAQAEQQQQLYGGQIVVDPAQNQYQYAPPYEQYQSGRRPSLFTGHLSTASSQPPNPETVSQVSHESPDSESDYQQQQQPPANSQSVQDSPAVSYVQQELQSSQNQQQTSVGTGQTQNMAPLPGGSGQSRRSGDNEKQMRSVEPPPGPPPGYRHSQGPINAMNPLPPTPSISGAPQNYRTSSVQEQGQYDRAAPEGGRNSPQPSTNAEREADPEKQFKDLLTKYKNVKRLYFDGKSQIEQLTSQVEQLQNAVANQRMSQSRTSLDDNEYSTRFNRLNGAINNLSFNIRKDWRTLPSWIERYVSPEAIKTGKQEMTAVGRAVIVRWIVDEIFNKCFHPALDVHLSSQLKQIEHNIRRFSYTLSSQEEYEALTAKVVNWRMATLEGLQHQLQAPEGNDYKADFTKMATGNLTATLFQYLTDPPPAGVDGSASMIVELVVGIASHLPMESRDVAITYPLPGDPIQPDFMEPEKTGLPPLPEPVDDIEESNDKDSEKTAAAKREKTKSGMLNMLSGTPYPGSRKGSTASVITDTTSSAAAAAAQQQQQQVPSKDPSKVRFAGFVAVEVRGRQVLVKAPVWTLG